MIESTVVSLESEMFCRTASTQMDRRQRKHVLQTQFFFFQQHILALRLMVLFVCFIF